jgi:hypothetical protein
MTCSVALNVRGHQPCPPTCTNTLETSYVDFDTWLIMTKISKVLLVQRKETKSSFTAVHSQESRAVHTSEAVGNKYTLRT